MNHEENKSANRFSPVRAANCVVCSWNISAQFVPGEIVT